MQGTTLADVPIDGVHYAGYVAGEKPNGFTPLKLIVPGNNCCCAIVPDGFKVHAENLAGAVDVSPGCQCWGPFTNVRYLIPLHLFVYDAAPISVYSRDNIPITISTSITFRACQDYTTPAGELKVMKAEDFNAICPASSLNERLRAAMTEGVRTLAVAHDHVNIYDLQGVDCETQIAEMNEKLEPDGVKVVSFIIQEVTLPQESSFRMQEETISPLKQRVNEVNAEESALRARNADALQIAAKRALVDQERVQAQAETTKAAIELRTSEIKSKTSQEMARLGADMDRQVNKLVNDAELEVAQFLSQAEQVKRDVEVNLAKELNNLAAEGRQYNMQKETELASQVAEDKANATNLVGQAEASAAESEVLSRKFEEDKAQLEVFARLVDNKNLRIASSAECNARGMSFNDDRANQFLHSAMRFFHTKFTELAPAQEPLLG